jgi:uncharacterized protein YecT (DUF1311 family)
VLVAALSFFDVSVAQDETSANLTAEKADDGKEYVSPKGNYHIEWKPEEGEPFIVSTKNSAERAHLPDAYDTRDPDECQVQFHWSLDENWLFYTESWRHHAVREQELYHRETGVKFTPVKGKKWFAQAAQLYAIKNGGFRKSDFHHEPHVDENHLETDFRCWSFDSSRLLFGIYADFRERGPFYVYFNTRMKKFELTDYLRTLNKTKSEFLACAEPVDLLPSEAELKTKFDALDRQLNKRYAEVIAKTDKDRVSNVREAQRNWIKHRDEGAKFYVSRFPSAEKERRRLQFLVDVTEARVGTSFEFWEL